MRFYSTLALIFLAGYSFAQQNGLSFDGLDDNVTVANASSLIVNATHLSMAFWVYPENSAPSFPDYDGFCGFRNNTDADFYLLQLSANSVEARFRNSAGNNFDIVDSGMTLNQWQHYVLTYDGTTLSLYRDDQLIQSVPANGSIASAAETMYIGDLVYSANDFYLIGKIDEVSLWDSTLSPSEIHCIYKSYVDTGMAGLKLYYSFNQGIAGGNNSSVQQLHADYGTLNGTLNNFTLSGPVSNWVQGVDNATPVSGTICYGQTYTFNTDQLTAPGTYYDTLSGSAGCDSLVRLDLRPTVDDSISILANQLHAMQSGATYNWIDCSNQSSTGITTQDFTPPAIGNYAVIITYHSCTDTSDCIFWNPAGIESIQAGNVELYPNPVTDNLHIIGLKGCATVDLLNTEGKRIRTFEISDSNDSIDLSSVSPGNYFLRIKNRRIAIMKY